MPGIAEGLHRGAADVQESEHCKSIPAPAQDHMRRVKDLCLVRGEEDQAGISPEKDEQSADREPVEDCGENADPDAFPDPAVVSCPVILAAESGSPGAQRVKRADREHVDARGDRVGRGIDTAGRAYGGQRVRAEKTADDRRVRQIVKLLEQVAQQKREGKPEDQSERIALCHIFHSD